MSKGAHLLYAAGMDARRKLMLITALSILAVPGCGGATEGEATQPAEAAEATELSATEGAETVEPADTCDEASISLVGRYMLTHYPGQDTLGPNGERPMGMSKEYDFGADSYTMDGYPPLRITGRYEELAREGARVQVRFFDTVFDGRPSEDRVLWLLFEGCGATLQMDGMTYARRPAE